MTTKTVLTPDQLAECRSAIDAGIRGDLKLINDATLPADIIEELKSLAHGRVPALSSATRRALAVGLEQHLRNRGMIADGQEKDGVRNALSVDCLHVQSDDGETLFTPSYMEGLRVQMPLATPSESLPVIPPKRAGKLFGMQPVVAVSVLLGLFLVLGGGGFYGWRALTSDKPIAEQTGPGEEQQPPPAPKNNDDTKQIVVVKDTKGTGGEVVKDKLPKGKLPVEELPLKKLPVEELPKVKSVAEKRAEWYGPQREKFSAAVKAGNRLCIFGPKSAALAFGDKKKAAIDAVANCQVYLELRGLEDNKDNVEEWLVGRVFYVNEDVKVWTRPAALDPTDKEVWRKLGRQSPDIGKPIVAGDSKDTRWEARAKNIASLLAAFPEEKTGVAELPKK